MVWWPNRAVYVLVGVDFTAAKHVLGLCIGKAGERPSIWVNLLARAA
jgi:hypothetical protein